MKKLLFTAVASVFCLIATSQETKVITGTKKIDKKFTPQQVMDSLNKRFPNAEAVQVYEVPKGGVNNGWTVTEEDNLDPTENVDYYTISFKNSGLKYYGLYNADGTLVKAKVEESVDQLPEAVKTSLKKLGQQYPGYKVVSKTYYKNQNYNKSKEYYEIIAQKGDTKKSVYYAPDGTLLKMK